LIHFSVPIETPTQRREVKNMLKGLKMGSEKLSKLKDLRENLNPLIEGNIVDIIVFGSVVKRKHKPKDVDVAVVVREEKELELEELSGIRERIKDFFESVDTEVIEPEDIYTTKLGLRIILEGYSILKSGFLNDVLGVEASNIYEYSLEKLDRSGKTRFNRALRGVIDELGGEKIGRGVIKVPRRNSGEAEDIFKRWDIWDKVKTTEIFEY
jgi:predicted nucleotidyltransferase